MKKRLSLICDVVIVFVIALMIIDDGSCKVLELDERFAKVSKDGLWLVMFYAPWCGHCKKLEPTWIKVGAILKEQQPDVHVARLDATKFTSLSGLYKIKGFPTIKFFKNGHALDYNGARNEHSITAFVNRAKRLPVTHLRDDNALQNVRQHHSVFYLYVGSDSDSLHGKFMSTASLLFTRLSFFSMERSKLPSDIEIQIQNTILVFKDGKYYEIPEPIINENIVAWMMQEQFPTYNHLTAISYHELKATGKPYAIAVLDRNDPFNVTMQGIAFKRSYPYTFCWVEGNQLVNSITYASISVPNLVVYDERTRDYYVLHEETPVAMTKANVEEFFSRIMKGEQPARGGSSVKEQAKRAMGDFANFFIDLFNDSPILAVVLILVPSFIVVVCCICCCTMSDDGDMSSDMDSEEEDLDFEDERIPNPDDVETNEALSGDSGQTTTEGLRQRIKEVQKDE